MVKIGTNGKYKYTHDHSIYGGPRKKESKN